MGERGPRATRKAGRFKDARGTSVTLLDPYELNVLRRYDVIPAETLRRIAERIGFGLPKWQRLGYMVCVGIFLAGVVFLVFWKLARGTGVDQVERVLWPVNFVIFAVGAIVFWAAWARARASVVCAMMLEHLRCPHCGYDLRLLPPDATDGATVCPECGCAWKLTEPGPTQARNDDGDTR